MDISACNFDGECKCNALPVWNGVYMAGGTESCSEEGEPQLCAINVGSVRGVVVTSPDGYDADWGGKQAYSTTDGNEGTYWDQEDNVEGPHILQVKGAAPFEGYKIIGYENNNYSPKTWELECDDTVVQSVEHYFYSDNIFRICFGVTYVCSVVRLVITDWYGLSPGVREFTLTGTFGRLDYTSAPSSFPTNIASFTPSKIPSSPPSNMLSDKPTLVPSTQPSTMLSDVPTSSAPSSSPSVTVVHTKSPTKAPVLDPTKSPVPDPTKSPVVDACTENKWAKWLFKFKSNGDAKPRDCDWLAGLKAKNTAKLCKNKTDFNDDYDTPKQVCPITCKVCIPCKEDPDAKFVLKLKNNGKPKKKLVDGW